MSGGLGLVVAYLATIVLIIVGFVLYTKKGKQAAAEGDVGEARRLWSLAAAGYDTASVLGAEAVRAKQADVQDL